MAFPFHIYNDNYEDEILDRIIPSVLDRINIGGEPKLFKVEVKLPLILSEKAFKDERSISLLQVATIIYNNELECKPDLGFTNIIVFLQDEKMEYNVRVHCILFEPELDLDTTILYAEISTTDDRMICRLIEDKVLSFYVSGKLTQNESGNVETIVINKIKGHVDQTAYAKRFKELKKNSDNVPDKLLRAEIFNNPNITGIEFDVVTKAWKKFQSKI